MKFAKPRHFGVHTRPLSLAQRRGLISFGLQIITFLVTPFIRLLLETLKVACDLVRWRFLARDRLALPLHIFQGEGHAAKHQRQQEGRF